MVQSRNVGSRGLLDLCLLVSLTFFALKAAGRSIGAIAKWGGGYWGVLRSLKVEGPQTLVQLARSRPVSRQRIQRIASELGARGFVEFRENPAHQRSKLLHLTRKGEIFLKELDRSIESMAAQFTKNVSPAAMDTTLRTLENLRACVRHSAPIQRKD
jgi:DNA-binding MarR family transcriptional regulator